MFTLSEIPRKTFRLLCRLSAFDWLLVAASSAAAIARSTIRCGFWALLHASGLAQQLSCVEDTPRQCLLQSEAGVPALAGNLRDVLQLIAAAAASSSTTCKLHIAVVVATTVTLLENNDLFGAADH